MSSSHGGPNSSVAPDATERLAMLEAWLLEKDQTDSHNAYRMEAMFGLSITLSNGNTARLNERLIHLDNMVSQLTREVSKMAESVTVLSGEVAGLKSRLGRAESVDSQSQRPSSHAAEPSVKRTSSAMQEGSRKRNKTSPIETPQSRETHPRDPGNISTPGAWEPNAAIRTPQSEGINSIVHGPSGRLEVRDMTSASAKRQSLDTHGSGHGGSTSRPGPSEGSAVTETPQFEEGRVSSQGVVGELGAIHPSDAGEMVESRPTSKPQFVWPEPLSEPDFGPFGEPVGSFSLEDWPVAAPKPLLPPPPTMLPYAVYHRPRLIVKLRLSAAKLQRLESDGHLRRQ
jgi:hypothetical protein